MGAADLAVPRHVQYNALAGIAAGVFQCVLAAMWLLQSKVAGRAAAVHGVLRERLNVCMQAHVLQSSFSLIMLDP